MQANRAEMNENNFEWFQLLGRLGVSAVGYPFEYVKVLIQVNTAFYKNLNSSLEFALIFIVTHNFSCKIQQRFILKLRCYACACYRNLLSFEFLINWFWKHFMFSSETIKTR